MKITKTVRTRPATMAAKFLVRPTSSKSEIIVVCFKRGIFDCPITLRFTDQRAVIVRIPESKAGILSLVCNKPVTRPAKRPAKKETIVDVKGSQPNVTSLQVTAAPKVKQPSAVKSAISSNIYADCHYCP